MRTIIAIGCALAATACGSSGGDGVKDDPTGCDGRAQLSGGVDKALDISACGTGGSTMTLGEGIGDGVSLRFDLGRELGPTEVGSFPATKASLTARASGGQEVWEAAAGVCTVKLDSRAAETVGERTTLQYGTGSISCSGPLAAVAPNTKAPVTVGTVTFTGLVPSRD